MKRMILIVLYIAYKLEVSNTDILDRICRELPGAYFSRFSRAICIEFCTEDACTSNHLIKYKDSMFIK